jgi:3-dehydroquinate synthase
MRNTLNSNSIFIGEDSYNVLNNFLINNAFSSVFVLVDTHTEKYCLQGFLTQIDFNVKPIVIKAGEAFKTIDTCVEIWEFLSSNGADRKSLLINLGGGVVTDIGGFAASCFRRGINFLHIPTTLLGMVDAAIGGKNGVDLNQLKNQIGIVRQPEMILYDYQYLSTLPLKEIKSGFAEAVKHGLIQSKPYFKDCVSIKQLDSQSVLPIIEESIKIKLNIVLQDTNENGIRKALNFGHTLGHAIETFRMGLEPSKHQHLLHGEAIAIGLVLETYISKEMFGFPDQELERLKAFVDHNYAKQQFSIDDQNEIIRLMKFDKKNVGSNVNFVLLKDIGQPVLDCKVDNDLIYKAFEYYLG